MLLYYCKIVNIKKQKIKRFYNFTNRFTYLFSLLPYKEKAVVTLPYMFHMINNAYIACCN